MAVISGDMRCLPILSKVRALIPQARCCHSLDVLKACYFDSGFISPGAALVGFV